MAGTSTGNDVSLADVCLQVFHGSDYAYGDRLGMPRAALGGGQGRAQGTATRRKVSEDHTSTTDPHISLVVLGLSLKSCV